MKIAESQQKKTTFIYETFNKTKNIYIEIINETFCQLFNIVLSVLCFIFKKLQKLNNNK